MIGACSGSADVSVTTTVTAGGDPASTTTGPSTTPPGEETTSTQGQPAHDRELAPDFTLALAEGGTYTLSEGSKPVYLVFWAEWCPTCRRELPVVDRIAAEYGDRVDFVAPVWKSDEAAAFEAAAALFPSGQFKWGMDSEEVVFGLYRIPYQPVTVLIASDQTVVEVWPGVRSESQIRSALDDLLALSP